MGTHNTPSRPTVVLVDDSEDVRSVIHRRLTRAGFVIVGEGDDGDQAALLAYRFQPNLLLLDTSMPRVDGIEALPAILTLSPDTKVVMFTGFDEAGLAEHARRLGAADFIDKSLSLEHLAERLWLLLTDSEESTFLDDSAITASLSPARPLHVVSDPVESPPAQSERRSQDEQAALTEHVQQFRTLFDQAQIGMATLTTSGTIVRANQALADLIDATPLDLVGLDYGRLTSGEGEQLDRALDALSSKGKELIAFEHSLPGSGQGNARTARTVLAPIRDAKREVLYVFAQVEDVTDQRGVKADLQETGESFRRLVMAVDEYAIYLLDPAGRVASWNHGAQRIKGYLGEEIIGQHYRLFYPTENQAVAEPERNLEHALQQGSYAGEGWRVRKDGSRFWASVVITPVFDEEGAHLGFAKVTRDHTEQREHEEQRRALLEQQAHVLAVTAHELRTPIAVIDGSAAVLQRDWNELQAPERDDLLTGVRQASHRLRRLASDLSTASRLRDDNLDLHLEAISLRTTLKQAVDRARSFGAGLDVGVDSVEDATLIADPGRIEQVIDNLVDNALRHGMPPVLLSGRRVEQAIEISVTDCGHGVPDDVSNGLFEPFSSAGPARGTGLGLYLAREIARRHGGDVHYRPPEREKPTAFSLALPIREPQVALSETLDQSL